MFCPRSGSVTGEPPASGCAATETLTPAWEREGQARAELAECGIRGLDAPGSTPGPGFGVMLQQKEVDTPQLQAEEFPWGII